MSKDEIIGYVIACLVMVGFSVWFFVVAYDRYYYCDVCCPFSDTVVGLFMAIFCAILARWSFVLSYCFTYRVIDGIVCADGKLRFNSGGKSFEDAGHVFLKITLYTSEPPSIPTHMFIWLRSGPWLCPFALWKDCAKVVTDETIK